MKPCFSVFVFILLPFVGFCQSSSRATGLTNLNVDAYSIPGQYLWGYSNNKSGNSEKSLIDFNAIDNWRGLGNYLAVSNNGRFLSYTINKPTGTRYWFNRLDSLVVQSTYSGARFAFAGSTPGFFTATSDLYIFQQGETLCFLPLNKSQPRYIKDVASYKVSHHGKNEWLAYQLKSNEPNIILHNLVTGRETPFSGITNYNFDNTGEWLVAKRDKELMLYNLVTNAEKHVPFVEEYAFANNGKAVLLKAIEKTDVGVTTSLKYLEAPGWQEKIIWSTTNKNTAIGSYSLDGMGRQVVFSSQDSAGVTTIWYFNAGMKEAILKVDRATTGVGEGLSIDNYVSFSDNGRYIKFYLQLLQEIPKPDASIAQVEVWDHKDLYLQATQAKLLKQPNIFSALFNIEQNKVVLLENNGKKLYLQQGDFAVVKKYPREEHGDRFWEVNKTMDVDSNWIVSLQDGSSQVLPTSARSGNFWFSPGGRYMLYFDINKGGHYFSYELNTGVLKDISTNVPVNQLALIEKYSGHKPEFGHLAAWLEGDAGVLVYDNYDIWKLDLTGKEACINITNGVGHTTNTMLILPTTDHFSSDIPILKAKAPLLLRAFNTKNKESGFYRKANLSAGVPDMLFMGDYFMNSINGYHDGNVMTDEGLAPVKAKDGNTWIVQRQSGKDAPNYYETTDFKDFRRITNFQPQSHFRWLTEELHSFTHLDGREGQGILYKPDDFDSTKKYPVLIVFYGAFANNLNQFHAPSYIDQAMEPGKSPVWLVNNGYLVFTPDIYTTALKYGPSASNVIEGAVQYLKQLPYVDANKLGCASHSWSAKLGAYLFTHSTSFSATAISEGFIHANPINIAFTAIDGKSKLEEVEAGQEYGNLYENKEAWIEQTTVLQADKATSPLLLFCNKESTPEYQDQTLQLFTALRRLDKYVWWLKYDNGNHTLHDLKELQDYTIRYTQFFNHYLKEAPAPLWMTQGIPLMLKGVESRYKLDPSGSCGRDCKICKKWNEQYTKHPDMFTQPITDWRLE